MINAVQVWNADDWELFSLSLLQRRHGALNVRKIPAAHKGDFGIDYYCVKEAVAYQCYSVEEPVDISTRAERQKKKITSDLGKLIANHIEVAKLFLGVPIKYWVLLAPLHDSKDINLHCAKKTIDLRNANCTALDPLFEVTIQDFNVFPSDVTEAAISALSTLKLAVPSPSQTELDAWTSGSSDLLANATQKLKKRATGNVEELVADAVKFFLHGNALLDALRSGSPDLHEKIVGVIKRHARRLQFAGPQSTNPTTILHTELNVLVAAMQAAVPSLSDENAEQIAFGSISEWIMRCPLDFPNAS